MTTEFSQMIDDYVKKEISGMLIGCVALIESHDVKTMKAVVKPLLRYKDKLSGNTVPFQPIPDVPVQFIFAGGYYIRPKYSHNDLVWLSFSSYETTNPMKKSPANIEGALFPRSACSVVCGLFPIGTTPPDDFLEDGLAGGHIGGGMSFVFSENGIKIKGNLDITGNITTDGEVKVTGEVTAKSETNPIALSDHYHMTGDGPSGKSLAP